MTPRLRPVIIATTSGARLFVHMAYAEVIKRYHQARRREQPTMQLDGRTVWLEHITAIEPPAEDDEA
jgi:hypothetical protein